MNQEERLRNALTEILSALRMSYDDPTCSEDERSAFSEAIAIVLNTARRVGHIELDDKCC